MKIFKTLRNKVRNNEGFTLIELAISMTIFGLFLIGLITVYRQYAMEKREAEYIKTIDAVTSALAYYVLDESTPDTDPDPAIDNSVADLDIHYPCPADPSLDPGDAGFGVEARDGATNLCNGAVLQVETNGAGENVYVGTVPFATLQIGGQYSTDPYGHKLTYAVSESTSVTNAFAGGANPAGSITVTVVGGDDVDDAPFALVSHGPDGSGAFGENGIALDCVVGRRDTDNCNSADGTLGGVNQATYIEASTLRGFAENADHYDDRMVFSLRGIADKENFWGLGNDSQDIVTLNTSNVGIGEANPQEKLHLSGNAQIDDGNVTLTFDTASVIAEGTNSIVGANEFCNEASGECFQADHIHQECGANEYLAGYGDNGPVCNTLPAVGGAMADFSCDPGEMLVGFTGGLADCQPAGPEIPECTNGSLISMTGQGGDIELVCTPECAPMVVMNRFSLPRGRDGDVYRVPCSDVIGPQLRFGNTVVPLNATSNYTGDPLIGFLNNTNSSNAICTGGSWNFNPLSCAMGG